MADSELAGRYREQLNTIIERSSRNALVWLAALFVTLLGLQQGACSSRELLEKQLEQRTLDAVWLGPETNTPMSVPRASDPALVARRNEVRRATEELDEIEFPGIRIRLPRLWTPVAWTFGTLALLMYLGNRRHLILLLCGKAIAIHRKTTKSKSGPLDLVADVPWWVAPLPVRGSMEGAEARDILHALGVNGRRAGMAISALLFVCAVSAVAVVVFIDALVLADVLGRGLPIQSRLTPALTAFACLSVWAHARHWIDPVGAPAATWRRLFLRPLLVVIAVTGASMLLANARLDDRSLRDIMVIFLADYRVITLLVSFVVATVLVFTSWSVRSWIGFCAHHIEGKKPSPGLRRTHRREMVGIATASALAGTALLGAEVRTALIDTRPPRKRKPRPVPRVAKAAAYATEKDHLRDNVAIDAVAKVQSELRVSRPPRLTPWSVVGAAAAGAAVCGQRLIASPANDSVNLLTRRRWVYMAATLIAGVAAAPAVGWRRLSHYRGKAVNRFRRGNRARLESAALKANTFVYRAGHRTVHYVTDGTSRSQRLPSINQTPAPTILDLRRLGSLGAPSQNAVAVASTASRESDAQARNTRQGGGRTSNDAATTVVDEALRRRGSNELRLLEVSELLASNEFHVNLANASVSFEAAAMNLLQVSPIDYERIRALLVLAIEHDVRYKVAARRRPSFRLYDLAAGLHVRYAPDPNNVSIMQNNPAIALLERMQPPYANDPYVRTQIARRLTKWREVDGDWWRCWRNQLDLTWNQRLLPDRAALARLSTA